MSIVKLNNRGVKDATAFGSISSLGSLVFISKQTASSSATISFTSGIDSTYKEYLFTFKNIHPATDSTHLQFQANASGGSGYNETMTTSHIRAVHDEGGSDQYVHYHNDPTHLHQANGTSFQSIASYIGSDNDQNGNGILHLFNPSSTVFVKNFMSEFSLSNPNNYIQHNFVAGYFNTTSAIDEIQFKMSSGNIDSGDICLYGIN